MMISAVCKLTRRAKFLFLLLLALVLLVWITSFAVNDTIRAIQESPRLIWGSAVDLRNVNSPLGGAKHDRPSQLPAAATEKPTRPPLQICSEHPPLLRGAIALSFPPSLSLSDVEEENREQLSPGGQSQPSNCISRQKVAVLIPHRNREKHLLYLLHYLHPFLQRQQLHYGIYVIHQAGNVAFNRAKLLNVGYLEALKDQPWDCFIFHDVDLVPENDHNLYTCDTQQPKHLVVGRNVTGYKLRYKGYFGGVTAMTKEQFSRVNGFSNGYWGWGGEDDDLRIRVELQKMKIVRPSPEVGRYTMVFHKRDVGNEINKDRMSLLRRTPQMWRSNGLNSCSYRTVSIQRVPLYVNITVEIGHP
ncbi:beta-1,4-galactosyltransferase 4 [Alosa sapidissima]|uniref:beta-1,4-galactosyltransferase 4 n=1 Tax=Alosa sapidissima TaxID=34773 RepID=UPI001C0875FD|nr:beta-1,4-galactosyltransferase 4 [Alosa sapidissima]XP_041930043.1 beta-1,4-galactosyltransferase 4 [Alosa sapidissima]XP_041930052.1 beta-1,4-galactosyltransferase 4 [Alosa sapidissima]XP_041930061.1 beta-1,4-galactosyltransferase 4 [Alosa sapidissima]XP_041930069.1 beta-1,4-galactosyltransferase 4 [Alosa sapidissima]XP_041930076.1 beta-1,4-galactosyltransferase 4 [Alosa sapidissima]XP_041930085.1 beta-1,4-galactosyltransferase 4 [Alosa sapidissima]